MKNEKETIKTHSILMSARNRPLQGTTYCADMVAHLAYNDNDNNNNNNNNNNSNMLIVIVIISINHTSSNNNDNLQCPRK